MHEGEVPERKILRLFDDDVTLTSVSQWSLRGRVNFFSFPSGQAAASVGPPVTEADRPRRSAGHRSRTPVYVSLGHMTNDLGVQREGDGVRRA